MSIIDISPTTAADSAKDIALSEHFPPFGQRRDFITDRFPVLSDVEQVAILHVDVSNCIAALSSIRLLPNRNMCTAAIGLNTCPLDPPRSRTFPLSPPPPHTIYNLSHPNGR